MKKEIEKILFEYEDKYLSNYLDKKTQDNWYLKNEYANKLLSIFSSKIAECEKDIGNQINALRFVKPIYHSFDMAHDIITLIQNKIKE